MPQLSESEVDSFARHTCTSYSVRGVRPIKGKETSAICGGRRGGMGKGGREGKHRRGGEKGGRTEVTLGNV